MPRSSAAWRQIAAGSGGSLPAAASSSWHTLSAARQSPPTTPARFPRFPRAGKCTEPEFCQFIVRQSNRVRGLRGATRKAFEYTLRYVSYSPRGVDRPRTEAARWVATRTEKILTPLRWIPHYPWIPSLLQHARCRQSLCACLSIYGLRIRMPRSLPLYWTRCSSLVHGNSREALWISHRSTPT